MAITRAIKKYGKKNFKIDKICECFNQNQLDVTEKYYICVFDSRVPNGYNILEGGNGGKMHSETKQKISKALSGKKKTKEHAKKVIQSRKKTYENFPERKPIPGNKNKITNSDTRKALSLKKKKKSIYLGVIKDGNKWRMEIYFLGKKISKTYISEEAAARAYDLQSVKYGLSSVNFCDVWEESYLEQYRSKKIVRKSLYYGVIEKPHQKKFECVVWFSGKRIFLGSFKTEIEAAQHVDNFLIKNGLLARNFLEKQNDLPKNS
jgi:hypothetical protein